MLFEEGAVQGAGDVGDGNGIVQADVARQVDLDDLVARAQPSRQIAVNILDRCRIRRRAFRAVAVNENDRLHGTGAVISPSSAATFIMSLPIASAKSRGRCK